MSLVIRKLAINDRIAIATSDVDEDGFLNFWFYGQDIVALTIQRPSVLVQIEFYLQNSNQNIQNLENLTPIVSKSKLVFNNLTDPLVISGARIPLSNQIWTLKLTDFTDGVIKIENTVY